MRPISVLVVDDDHSGREMLALSLRQAGLRVQTASSGREALELLNGGGYDWLITDGKMQPMSGFELALQAKTLRPKLRILMVSAIYNKEDIAGYPIEDLFPKPVPLEALLEVVSGQSN